MTCDSDSDGFAQNSEVEIVPSPSVSFGSVAINCGL